MTLEGVFQFNADDLDSNSNGKLTARQQEMLKSYRKFSSCGTIAALVAIIGTIGILSGIVLLNTDSETSGMQQALPYIVGVFGFAFFLFIFFWLLGIYRSRYLRTPKIFDVTGKANPHLKKRQYHTEYYVSIGKVRFQVTSKAQYDAIQSDQAYRVYYIHYPPTHVILSIELLEQ